MENNKTKTATEKSKHLNLLSKEKEIQEDIDMAYKVQKWIKGWGWATEEVIEADAKRENGCLTDTAFDIAMKKRNELIREGYRARVQEEV